MTNSMLPTVAIIAITACSVGFDDALGNNARSQYRKRINKDGRPQKARKIRFKERIDPDQTDARVVYQPDEAGVLKTLVGTIVGTGSYVSKRTVTQSNRWD